MVDFNFNLNDIFPSDITAIRSDLLPAGYSGSQNTMMVTQKVSAILDVMGEASARAQHLKQPITSGAKLRLAEEQTAYLLIDRNGNGGLGSVVGLLKTGRKKLYLLDDAGETREMKPMCVLDFYVAEKKQRTGFGKQLFEHMVSQEGVHPKYMAVDRPSEKLISFLKKHYGLVNRIHQVNNYVVFRDIFHDTPLECTPKPKKARIYMGKLQYV